MSDYAQRNAQALAQTRRLAEELARHERLAALGRLTATVAHEIRNPIATMRLAVENDIAMRQGTPDDAAHGELMLGQIRRLDGVVSLLGMVQPIRLQLETVVVQDWLATFFDPALRPPGAPAPRLRARTRRCSGRSTHSSSGAPCTICCATRCSTPMPAAR